MLWKGFQRPKRVEVDTDSLTQTYGRFTAQPFERGFATTIGNALRRVLLSSLEGAAVTSIQINDVFHEFSTIPNVKEDVTQIVLNTKKLRLRSFARHALTLKLIKRGAGPVTAGDIAESADVEITNPDLVLLTGDFLTMEGAGTPGALARALEPLAPVAERCFAIFGNHDHEAAHEVRQGLATHGIQLLLDDAALVDTPAGPVQILGADWVPRGHRERLTRQII